jgi:hypothetical protein
MPTYFRLPWDFNPDDAEKFERLNYIARPFEGYSWGGDTTLGLLWFDGPQPATEDYQDAIDRWHRDLESVGLGQPRLTHVELPQ